MIKKVLIRADSNYSLGSGHVYRSLELANYLSKYFKIFFFTFSDKDSLSKKKIDKKIKIIYKKRVKANTNISENTILTQLYKIYKFDFLFIDTNSFLFKPNEYIINCTKKIYQITDIYKDTNNEITIINQNCYNIIENTGKNFLLGPRYSLIKKPLSKYVKKKIKKIIKVGVFFGNSDTKNITYKLLEILSINFNNLFFSVILGKDNIYKTKIYEKYKRNNKMKLYENVKNINLFFSKCDLAIGYPGHTQIERMNIGLPTILFSANNDQKYICKEIDKAKFGIYLSHYNDLDKRKIHRNLSNIFKKISKINDIRIKLIENFDGHGYFRIYKHLLQDY